MFLSNITSGVALQASLPLTPKGENQETHVGLASLLGLIIPGESVLPNCTAHNCTLRNCTPTQLVSAMAAEAWWWRCSSGSTVGPQSATAVAAWRWRSGSGSSGGSSAAA